MSFGVMPHLIEISWKVCLRLILEKYKEEMASNNPLIPILNIVDPWYWIDFGLLLRIDYRIPIISR